MTTEINSLVNNLRPLNQELSGSAVGRVPKGQEVAGPQSVAGSRGTSPAGTDPDRAKQGAMDENGLEGTVSELNALAQRMRRELQFTIEKDSGEMIVKVIDTETDEVIRQIPPEAVLELRKRLDDAAGVIFRDSV